MNSTRTAKKTKTTKVPQLTARQWELYYHRPGAKEAATWINKVLRAQVELGATREQTFKAVSGAMANYSDLGANDTEPRCILTQILNKIFGVR